MRKYSHLLMILASLTLWSCEQPLSAERQQQRQVQLKFTTALNQAIDDFQHLQRSDTIKFSELTQFDWDTVYIFDSYNDVYHINLEMDHPINWSKAMSSEDAIPERTTRFIFVKGDEAISYIDASRHQIGGVHFKKYYRNSLGELTTIYTDSKNNMHRYTVNHFAKSEAKFILVCNTSIPSGDSTRGVYLPLRLLQDKRFVHAGVKPTNLMELHSATGCGYENCLANSFNHM